MSENDPGIVHWWYSHDNSDDVQRTFSATSLTSRDMINIFERRDVLRTKGCTVIDIMVLNNIHFEVDQSFSDLHTMNHPWRVVYWPTAIDLKGNEFVVAFSV